MDQEKIGKFIAECRKKKKLTQTDVANKLGVTDKSVSKWERGICFPDVSALIPLTEILDISLYDLFKGEKMNKKEVEQVLRNTITYSNNEIKRKKKKYIIISSIIVSIVILVSIISIFIIKKDSEIGAIVDRDEIHEINYYIYDKTSINSEDGRKIESIFMKLPLKWKERRLQINSDSIDIVYGVSYKETVKAYNDENYVKLAMIDISTILFTTVDDIDKVSIKFTDYKYEVNKNIILQAFSINDIKELEDSKNWENIVSSKIESKQFVNKTFDTIFEKKKVISKEVK